MQSPLHFAQWTVWTAVPEILTELCPRLGLQTQTAQNDTGTGTPMAAPHSFSQTAHDGHLHTATSCLPTLHPHWARIPGPHHPCPARRLADCYLCVPKLLNFFSKGETPEAATKITWQSFGASANPGVKWNHTEHSFTSREGSSEAGLAQAGDAPGSAAPQTQAHPWGRPEASCGLWSHLPFPAPDFSVSFVLLCLLSSLRAERPPQTSLTPQLVE